LLCKQQRVMITFTSHRLIPEYHGMNVKPN
jgi:hypothetical protein